MDKDNKRYIDNKLGDYNETTFSLDALDVNISKLLVRDLNKFTQKVHDAETRAFCSVPTKSAVDASMFDGSGGYFVAWVKLHQFSAQVEKMNDTDKMKLLPILKEAKKVNILNSTDILLQTEELYKALGNLQDISELAKPSKKVMISYYFGAPGYYLTACHFNYSKGDFIGFQTNVKNLIAYAKYIIENSALKLFYNEMLYGVAGYLYCLLDLQKHYKTDNIDKKFVTNVEDEVYHVTKVIVEEGLRKYDKTINFDNLPPEFRLHYTFHDREYIGGAHGTFGVVLMLLTAYQYNKDYFNTKDKAFSAILLKTCKASLLTLVKKQFPSGNFPSSFGRDRDELVQFCHGSPGAVACLVRAYEVFKLEDIGKVFLDSAVKAGDNIWKFGLLKKGFGLCHGISGNGYALLTMYRATNDLKWLHRAAQFALCRENKDYMDVIENFEFEDRYVVGQSDYPYSLMMGLAGDVCFEMDLLFPQTAAFPGYEA
jgi:lantibiotic modifying enzyme